VYEQAPQRYKGALYVYAARKRKTHRIAIHQPNGFNVISQVKQQATAYKHNDNNNTHRAPALKPPIIVGCGYQHQVRR
jgi:hypothetical protein